MRKLISADFYRLQKEKSFWIAMAVILIGSVFFSFLTYQTALKNSDEEYYVEDILFNLLPAMGFVYAFLISMRLGTEYDEHTIRNKLIVGCSRAQVYFAEYVTCLAASLILLGVMLLSSVVCGYLFFHQFQVDGKTIIYLIFCSALIAAVFSALFTGIGMNIHSKAFSIVASVIFLLVILMLASSFISILEEEPMTYDYVRATASGIEYGNLVDNPAYVDGIQRKIYELISDILPTGQTIQLNNMDLDRASRWPLLSVIVLAVATMAGYIPFRKRDIR